MRERLDWAYRLAIGDRPLMAETPEIKIFHKREEELRHAIRHGLGDERIRRAAERLREAKFAVFKANFSQRSVLPAHDFSVEKAAEVDPVAER